MSEENIVRGSVDDLLEKQRFVTRLQGIIDRVEKDGDAAVTYDVTGESEVEHYGGGAAIAGSEITEEMGAHFSDEEGLYSVTVTITKDV